MQTSAHLLLCHCYVRSNLKLAPELCSSTYRISSKSILLYHPGSHSVTPDPDTHAARNLQFELHSVAEMAMARAFPRDKGSKEATFTALAANFGFHDRIKDLLLSSHMTNLDDFRYHFAYEDEIDNFVAIPEWSAPYLGHQTSMVKQAWTAVRQMGVLRDRNTPSLTTWSGNFLELILKAATARFWKRYKLNYSMEVFPSNCLLSRCHTEIERRLLTFYDVQTVDASPRQTSFTGEDKHAGTSRSTSRSGSSAEHMNQKVVNYLSALHTYLLALAVVGSAAVQGAPSDETFGSDPAKFVEVPLDILQAYHLRASLSVMLRPEASRLAWLRDRDTKERTTWARRLRASPRSLGQVIRAVMKESDNDWYTRIPERHQSKYKVARRQKWVAKRTAAKTCANVNAFGTTSSTTTLAPQFVSTLCPDLGRKKEMEHLISRPSLHHLATHCQSRVAHPVPAPSPQLIGRQKRVLTNKRTTAGTRAQTNDAHMRSRTSSQSLQDKQASCPGFIRKANVILHQMSRREISHHWRQTKRRRFARQQWWAKCSALREKEERKPRTEAPTRTFPALPNNTVKPMSGAISTAPQYGRILQVVRNDDTSASRRTHQPTRGKSTAATQVSSSSHYRSTLLPRLNEGIITDKEAIKNPVARPMTDMKKEDPDTSARESFKLIGMAPVSGHDTDMGKGAYVKQALRQQQQRDDLGGRDACTDMVTASWQHPTNDLVSGHSMTYPGSPNAPPGFYRDEWLHCHWCGKREMSLCPPVLPAAVLPLRCTDDLGYSCDACRYLGEPPLYPKAIQRCARSLEHIMPRSLRGNSVVLTTMSSFVVWNGP